MTQVRKQKGKYGEAIVKHKRDNKNKVEIWKKALVDASNLSGWEPKNIANGHEAQVIKQIVENISSRLQLITSNANENLIGIAARVQGLRSQLQIGSRGVRMIGIWGVGGGGKTTLASCVYDEISIKFDGCCFLKNIREESRRHGLEALQEKVLSKLGANNLGGGRSLINKRFRHRKILLILDDVDHLDQLEALAGSPNWFGEGSRIIITTRDEHLLKAHKVMVHDISFLKDDEAIALFHKHAYRDSTSVMEDYEHLSKEVLSYASGLPLALKVLGCCLCDKNIEQWRSALARLKKTPDVNILEKLKVSYDGLTKDQKGLFLDIACFFRWEEKDRAMKILDACGFHTVIGVEELRQKALITIDSDGCFDMHDLVQEMGHYIVRGEHPNNPTRHTRVWEEEDVLEICAMDAAMELDMIEAIIFEGDHSSLQPVPPIVANMKNLRWIHWEGRLASPLPNNFPPRKLCCLILVGILEEQLWNGYKYLPNLKIMELWQLENLAITPNFDGLPNLESIKLYNCPELEEIEESLGRLEGLVSVHIEYCCGIKKFPSIMRLKKLETLSFSHCPRLFEFSEKMENLPHNNLNHIHLCFSHKDLIKLDLSGCNLGDEYMSSVVWELPKLQQLNLSGNEFSRLNFGLMRLPGLKLLKVSYCSDLVELLELPSSIVVLKANFCTLLESLGDITNCKWLWKLLIWRRDDEAPPLVDGDILLDSMLKGHAIEDHHISVALPHQMIEKGVVDRLFKGNTFTLHLPHDWYNDVCGFLIHLITYNEDPDIDIIMKTEVVDEDPPSELWQESSEAPEPDQYGRTLTTYVGYVSFSWLRRNACFNSRYNLISFTLRPSKYVSGDGDRLGAALVLRKTTHYPLQTTKLLINCSQFWDEEEDYSGKTFTIQHDSNLSINILWKPCYGI